MQKLQKRKSEGFTIIEVLIVLAIAGLIMVVVFLAVPNLQRNQRNTARRQDASTILTGADNQVSNANGSMPTDLSFYDLTTSNQLGGLTVGSGTSGTLTANQINLRALSSGNTYSATAPTTGDAVLVATNAQCVSGTTNQVSYKSRSIAVIYTVEKSSGYNTACIQS
jgi:prepilin-type N-terminal cleavage/methylation domain-containing protein